MFVNGFLYKIFRRPSKKQKHLYTRTVLLVFMISVYMPVGASFDFNKELSSARNIKDKQTRENTIMGLNAIRQYI